MPEKRKLENTAEGCFGAKVPKGTKDSGGAKGPRGPKDSGGVKVPRGPKDSGGAKVPRGPKGSGGTESLKKVFFSVEEIYSRISEVARIDDRISAVEKMLEDSLLPPFKGSLLPPFKGSLLPPFEGSLPPTEEDFLELANSLQGDFTPPSSPKQGLEEGEVSPSLKIGLEALFGDGKEPTSPSPERDSGILSKKFDEGDESDDEGFIGLEGFEGFEGFDEIFR
jgi:hypothetical protein